MYLKQVIIKNLKVFEELDWNLSDKQAKSGGWHVVIGDNSSGKSTFLRAIAIAVCGPHEIQGLREDWSRWIRHGSSESEIRLRIHRDDVWDDGAGQGQCLQNYYPGCGLEFTQTVDNQIRIESASFTKHPSNLHVWNRKKGWFCASYGPFRRFAGGDPEQSKLFYSHPYLARHLTVFGENVALTEALEWLSQLRFDELDGDAKAGRLLVNVRRFVNQSGFLPHGVRFEKVSSKEVVFLDPEGHAMNVSLLSDGFRSILSFTFELIRQLYHSYQTPDIFLDKEKSIFIKSPGVVLIDEIDAHLHPTWQRQIGQWLTTYFPKIQFIVTTHSPLICQAAEKGSIFRLPTPGSVQKAKGFVSGKNKERLINGDVLDAFGTELFGQNVNRSESAQNRMEDLAILNQKALRGTLTEAEKKLRERLQKAFSNHAPLP